VQSTAEERTARVRAQLGEDLFAVAFAEGQAMDTEQAVGFASANA
jgi:hypothetical protein